MKRREEELDRALDRALDEIRAEEPDPQFAEAAIENGAAQTEKRRGRSLFQKVTGAVNSLVTDEEQASVTAPTATAPQPAREPILPVAKEPAPAPTVSATSIGNAGCTSVSPEPRLHMAPCSPSFTAIKGTVWASRSIA